MRWSPIVCVCIVSGVCWEGCLLRRVVRVVGEIRGSGVVEVKSPIEGYHSYRRCGIRRAGWRGRRPKKDVNSCWEICPVCRDTYLSMQYSRVALKLREQPRPVHNGYWCPKCKLIFGTDMFANRENTVSTRVYPGRAITEDRS